MPPYGTDRCTGSRSASAAHAGGNPFGRVGGDLAHIGGSLLSDQVGEAFEGLAVSSGGGPHQPACVMVDHHGEVYVSALVGDLVDPDAPQAAERVVCGPAVGHHSGDEGAHAHGESGHPGEV